MRRNKKQRGGGLNSLTAVISMFMVLTLVGIVVFFATMADNLGRSLRENFTVEVLLSDSLTVPQTQQLQRTLQRLPYVRHTTYTSKAEATRLQSEALGTNPEDFLGTSPIPASFELFLKADYAHSDSLAKVMPALTRRPEVLDVIYPKDLMDQVNNNIRRVSFVLLIIAALLTVVSVALINNTMRLSVARRKHSIQTMKLVGAKWSFIRRPFLGQAFWMGTISAFLADAALVGGMTALSGWDAEIGRLITPFVQITTLVAVPLTGILLTLICAFFSLNRQLGMSRSEAFFY